MFPFILPFIASENLILGIFSEADNIWHIKIQCNFFLFMAYWDLFAVNDIKYRLIGPYILYIISIMIIHVLM